LILRPYSVVPADWPEPPARTENSNEHTEISDEVWVIAVKFFRELGVWADNLGPPPGRSGCRAPLDVLQSYGFGKAGRRSA
jgi:hypothetical protein